MATCQSACSLWRRSLSILHTSHKKKSQICVSVLAFFKYKTFSCMCEVCTCLHVHLCECGYVSTVAQEWRSDGNPGCLASSSSWLETSSLVVHCCAHQATWPLRLPGFWYLHPHLPVGKLDLLNFMQVLNKLRSSHMCSCYLATEPSPQP